MLLEYSCKNFKSIGDEIKFSMLAGKDDSLMREIYQYNSLGVLKKSIIYGANGSGKSNFINSIEVLKLLISQSLNYQLNMSLPFFPHKMKITECTEYKIQMIVKDIRYIFGLKYNATNIVEEYLYYFPNDRRPAKIYDRVNDTITYGEDFKKDLIGVEKDYLKPNKLMLSCASNYRNIQRIQDVFMFFSNNIVIYRGQEQWRMYSAEQANKNPKLKNAFVSFMNEIGNKKVIGFESKIENIKIESSKLPPIFNQELINALSQQGGSIPKINFQYENFELDLFEESMGIQKLFDLFFPFIDIILNDKIFICDEFETHLHPIIVHELIKLFDYNTKKAQMIFTTHDVNLLDLSLYRRDQIWFTESNPNGFTDLYSLAELKSVRKDENIKKNYILGKYSGVPMINDEVKQHLLQEILGSNE